MKILLALFINLSIIENVVHFWTGGLAQLGERLAGSQKVSGSIPLVSINRETKKTLMIIKVFSVFRGNMLFGYF